MKKIPTVNYVKVVVLCLVTIFAVITLSNNYKKRIQYERANQDVMSFLSTVKYEELSSYLVENHDGFIYIASSSDSSLEDFEQSLKEYILSADLEKYFVYLDSSNFTDDMYKDMQESLLSSQVSKQVISQPNILAIQNGKIVSVLYSTSSTITLEDVKNFVNTYEGIE